MNPDLPKRTRLRFLFSASFSVTTIPQFELSKKARIWVENYPEMLDLPEICQLVQKYNVMSNGEHKLLAIKLSLWEIQFALFMEVHDEIYLGEEFRDFSMLSAPKIGETIQLLKFWHIILFKFPRHETNAEFYENNKNKSVISVCKSFCVCVFF